MIALPILPISPPIFPPIAPLLSTSAELEEFVTIVPLTACHTRPPIFWYDPTTVPTECTLSKVVLLASPAIHHTSPSPKSIKSEVLMTDHATVRSDILAAFVCLKSPT